MTVFLDNVKGAGVTGRYICIFMSCDFLRQVKLSVLLSNVSYPFAFVKGSVNFRILCELHCNFLDTW